MKRKFLTAIVGVSACLAVVVGATFLTAKAKQDKLAKEAEVAEESVDDSVFKGEMLKSFIDTASQFDLSTSEYQDAQGIFTKVLDKITDIYKEKKANYTDEELEIRAKVYWLSILETQYSDMDLFKDAMKYLDFTLENVLEVLDEVSDDLFVDADKELVKIALYEPLFDVSTLSEEDRKVFDEIKDKVKKDFGTEDEADVMSTASLIWGFRNVDVHEYTRDLGIDILTDFGFSIEDYIDLKMSAVKGSSEDMVKGIYQIVLLRDGTDEEISKSVGEFDKLLAGGSSVDEAKVKFADELKKTNEFKELSLEISKRLGF